MGGSDQWGNITAGCDLIRKVRATRVHGLVWPLMTTSSGSKFGKTEVGTVWLDADLTSPYRFYQFWLNTDDRDVVSYLKLFTWVDAAAIDGLAEAVTRAPEQREAQRALAREVTRLVHGEERTAAAERASALLFGSSLVGATADEILTVFEDVPSVAVPRSALAKGVSHTELAVRASLVASKGEATRLIKQGGLYLNDQRVSDERGTVTLDHAIDGKVIVLRKGQRERRLVRIVDAVA
jgi:tyrosyl-tRNA synthetase